MIHTRLRDEPVKTAREVVVLRELSVRDLLAELTDLQVGVCPQVLVS